MIQENEIPKYKKAKQSSTSKSKAKSKHKHQYEECLTQYEDDYKRYTSLSSYCTICGKLGYKFAEDKSIVKDLFRKYIINGNTYYSLMPSEELYENYHDKLPVFFLEDTFSKYVVLEETNNSDEK